MADSSRHFTLVSRRIFNATMFLLTLITLFTINPLPFYNGLASANIGISNPSTSSITLTSSTNITSLNLLPNTGFNLSPSATTASYDVLTDNFSGYTISILASDNDKTLVNTAAPTPITADYIFSSITSPILESNMLPTNSSLMNTWGIRPNKYVNTATTPYTVITNGNTPATNMILPSPDTTGILLDITTTPNPSTANSYDIKVGAMTDGTKAAGTYTKDTTLTVVPNPIYYTITYDENTLDTVTNMPTPNPVSSSTTATTINLSSSIPARDHYAFLGWCLGTISTTDGIDSCTNGAGGSGTIYNPNGDGTNLTFGIDQTTANITTLYAMWRISSVTVTLTAGTGIDTVAITGSGVKTGGTAGATSTAEVSYGGEITITATPTIGYAFVDWTGDTTYTDNPKTISSVTTDLALTANAEQLDAIQNLTAASCTATASQVYDNRDGQIYTIQRLDDGRCWMMDNLNLGATTVTTELNALNTNVAMPVPAATFSQWNNTSNVMTNTNPGFVANPGTDTTSQASYGMLYNYCAITAGTICTASNTTNASYDICPAGWRLPTGTSTGEFQALSAAYSNSLR